MALLACPLAASCVTQNVHFEPPQNYPPSIESSRSAQHPLGTIIRLGEAPGANDGGMATESIVLEVDIRDPNVEERLNYSVFLNFDPNLAIPPLEVARMDLPDANGELVRPVSIVLARTLFSRRCNRVELFVTGEAGFRSPPNQRTPNLAGNIATATWFVVDDRAGEVSITDCAPWI